jgi:hypothetical protein
VEAVDASVVGGTAGGLSVGLDVAGPDVDGTVVDVAVPAGAVVEAIVLDEPAIVVVGIVVVGFDLDGAVDTVASGTAPVDSTLGVAIVGAALRLLPPLPFPLPFPLLEEPLTQAVNVLEVAPPPLARNAMLKPLRTVYMSSGGLYASGVANMSVSPFGYGDQLTKFNVFPALVILALAAVRFSSVVQP